MQIKYVFLLVLSYWERIYLHAPMPMNNNLSTSISIYSYITLRRDYMRIRKSTMIGG